MSDQILESTGFQSCISDYQSGFRKHHNTTTLLTNLIDEIRQNVERKNVSVLISLDLSRAFESISHDMLLNKLNSLFSFSRSACSLVKSFLLKRRQFVQYRSRISVIRDVVRGVPQGSILGPLFF